MVSEDQQVTYHFSRTEPPNINGFSTNKIDEWRPESRTKQLRYCGRVMPPTRNGECVMQMQELGIHLLNDGAVKVDGGAIFGQVPRVAWETMIKPDRRHRVRWGINSLLIQVNNKNILVDVGAGAKHDDEERESTGLNANRLKKELRDMDLTPKDIHYVVLTHLHGMHAGGGTRRVRNGDTVPTFPNARYLVQRAAWEDALTPNELGKGSFRSEDYLPLEKAGQIEFLEGDYEILPGVKKNHDEKCHPERLKPQHELNRRR